MSDETILGFTGQFAWIRRRVWFWRQREMEADGWYKSAGENLPFRPLMIKRCTLAELQREKTSRMSEALSRL